MIKGQKISVENIKWDRSVRQGEISFGKTKAIPEGTFAPCSSSFSEIQLHLSMLGQQQLNRVHAITIKLFDVEETIQRVLSRSESAEIDSADYSKKNRILNDILDRMVVIVDPALDSLKYLLHTRDLATGEYVSFEVRKIANRIEALHTRKKQKKFASDETTYASKIDEEYFDFLKRVMEENDHRTILRIILETLRQEFANRADIGIPPVFVIEDELTFEYAKRVNEYALQVWPKGESLDNCATFLPLSPQVLSNEALVEKIIAYIHQLKTKFLVIKIKNLKLEERDKSDETDAFKNICSAIIDVKKQKKDTVAILLEANTAMFAAAACGFDIISTSQVGIDDEKPFQTPKNRDTINGYYDPVKLFHRNDQYIRKMLANGGFKHKDCVCSLLTDYASAKRGWPNTKRGHFIKSVNDLYERIYQYAEQGMIEQVKIDLAKSRLSNYRQALPLIDYV